MSATNRGGTRNEADFYPTPEWCVHRLLDKLGPLSGRLLEPAVGDGAIVRAVNSHPASAHALRGYSWTTVDIRPEAEEAIKDLGVVEHVVGDFVAPLFPVLAPSDRWDWAITNPPFSLAMEFVGECVLRCDCVAMLLRLAWLASATRAPWLREHTPDVYVLPDRPSFTGDGQTDASDYAWMVWASGLQHGKIRILDSTPASVRRGREGER